VTNADLVLAVSEPTLSGRHDLERVILLSKHFQIPMQVVVNKWDINEEMTRSIEELAGRHGVETAGRIRYDRAVTDAMVREKSVVEYTGAPVAEDIKSVWERVKMRL